MRKKLFTAMIILAAFGFTACQEDNMNDLIQDTELTNTTDPDDDQTDPPPTNPPGGGETNSQNGN